VTLDHRGGRIEFSGYVISVGKYEERDLQGELSMDRTDYLDRKICITIKTVVDSCEDGKKLLFSLISYHLDPEDRSNAFL
jgi:hypothetical protein